MTQMVSNRPLDRWSRRPSMTTAAIGATLAVIVVSASAVVAIYAWPQTTPGRVTMPEVVVSLSAPIASLAPGEALRFTAPPGAAFTMIDGGGFNAAGHRTTDGWLAHTDVGLVALAADSSHLGCKVDFDSSTHEFTDPCGGSVYDIYGQVVRGPAASPLAHLSFRVVSANGIAVEGHISIA